MAPNSSLRERLAPAAATDPRDGDGAQVIDLATRNVLPTVSQRKKADGLGLAAGVLIVAALGGLTLWSMDSARNLPVDGDVGTAPPAPAVPAPVAAVPAPAVVAPAPAPAELAAPAPS
ncbi:MAG TPA: type VI secretion protein, partial [Novosphingobium sp.]|nr:type VI secretion protein [Novosphingobium sp.]